MVAIAGLTIDNGLAQFGGGIFVAAGSLNLADCILSGNQAIGKRGTGAEGAGGGLYVGGGTVTIKETTFSSNAAIGGLGAPSTSNGGPGGDGVGGGIAVATTANLVLNNSVLSGNRAQGGEGGEGRFLGGTGGIGGGGGIYLATGASLTLDNNTFSGNLAQGGKAGTSEEYGDPYGTGGMGSGGGLWVAADATAHLASSTMATNESLGGESTSGFVSGYGGGIETQGSLDIRNTVLANNSVNQNGVGPDLSGSLAFSGYNLIGQTQGGSGFDVTDLLDVDPLLGPLQNNGGPTKTMALLPGSPAIDAGDNTGAPKWDQRGRGHPRIVNGTIDIGAFEVQIDNAGPSTSGDGHGEERFIAALVSSLPLSMDAQALRSAVLFPGPSATPILTRGQVLMPEGPSAFRAVSVDQWFASSYEEAQGKIADRWPDREPLMRVGSNPDLLPEAVDFGL
jgi:hypothetical protein